MEFIPVLILVVTGALTSAVKQCSRFEIPNSSNTGLHVAYAYQKLWFYELEQCATHCLGSKMCKAITHDHSKTCRLYTKSGDDDTSLVLSQTGSVYVRKTDIPTAMAGECAGHTCDEMSICIRRENSVQCVPAFQGPRCGTPPNVSNAELVSPTPSSGTWATGDTAEFNCTSGSPASGGPSIMTCTDVNVWSYSFSC